MVKKSSKKNSKTSKARSTKKTKDLLLDKIKESDLVPEAEIMSKTEVKELLEKLGVDINKLPKIYAKDPLVRIVGAKKGDVLKIKRKGFIEEEDIYYRLVI